jgi:hypothetical protein
MEREDETYSKEELKETQDLIIKHLRGILPKDPWKSYRSIGFVGLSQMVASIPRPKVIAAILAMEGVDCSNPSEIKIPNYYFEPR